MKRNNRLKEWSVACVQGGLLGGRASRTIVSSLVLLLAGRLRDVALHFLRRPSAEAFDEAGQRSALPFERIVEAVEGTPSPKEET